MMTIYAVIDTNVLVSALISKKNDSATVQVVDKWLKGDFTAVYSKEVLHE